MKMPPETLTALLSGEHLNMEERAARGLLPLEVLRYADVRDHLASVISSSDYFPFAHRAHADGQPVDEHMVVERLGRHRFVCHSMRHHPLDPTQLAEESHRRFWSARAAAAYYLRWEHNLPGDLDGWSVAKLNTSGTWLKGTLLSRLSFKLSQLSRGKLTLAALGVFVLFMVLVLPAQAEVSRGRFSGVGSPDASFIYSADDIYGWAGAYGADGREAYVRARWSFDLVWPLVYGFFLVTAISWVGRRAYHTESRANLLNLVPVAAVLLDFSENVVASIVMLRYPNATLFAADLASPVTVLKWLCVGGSFVILLAGVLIWIWRLLHGAASPGD